VEFVTERNRESAGHGGEAGREEGDCNLQNSGR
jgi:hypothetical protein